MDLKESSLGFYRVWFAAVGTRSRLLRPEWATLATLARGLDAASVERYLRGATALGLTQARGGRYRLKPEHAKTLGDRSSDRDLSRHFQYLAAKSLTFGALDDLLRGKADVALPPEVYAIATGWDHVAYFERVLPKERETTRLLARGADVLDLGAGLGAWTREAKRRFPRSRFTMAEVAPRAGQIALRDVAASSFDLVYLGEVLSASGDARAPLATALRALRPGGTMHALEGLRPDGAARGWGQKLVTAMDLDFGLDGSRFLTVREASDALRDAGFVHRRIRDVGGSLYLLTGRRRNNGRRSLTEGREASRRSRGGSAKASRVSA